MSGGTHALVFALLAKATDAEVCEAASTPWCSATFAGERHVVALSFANAAAAAHFRDGLESYEFSLANSFVADIQAAVPIRYGDRLRVDVEALTIEAA